MGKLLQFCIPLIFSGMLQLLFNAADMAVIGRFEGDYALAAFVCYSALWRKSKSQLLAEVG